MYIILDFFIFKSCCKYNDSTGTVSISQNSESQSRIFSLLYKVIKVGLSSMLPAMKEVLLANEWGALGAGNTEEE